MNIFILLFGVFLTIGMFLIISDVLKLPKLATEKAILSMGSIRKQNIGSLDVWLNNLSIKLSKILKIDEYKRARMKSTLNAAGISKSPEEYLANCIMKSLVILIGIIPSLIIFPIISPIILIVAIMTYFKELNKADNEIKVKREKIELQLPRFVSTITQEIKNSRDVLKILDNFRHSANDELAKELDILTADMRSGSYETALTRFEARINSPMLSDIVRGLISVLRGDDGAVYFQMLAHDMKQLELQKLKLQAMKIPAKIRKFSFLMLMCFMLVYIVVIGSQIISSMSDMF